MTLEDLEKVARVNAADEFIRLLHDIGVSEHSARLAHYAGIGLTAEQRLRTAGNVLLLAVKVARSTGATLAECVEAARPGALAKTEASE